ncbi:MAG: hypothetical protein B5M53_07260 [Candidatus Cloacimonas sp. 4484_209]|nr:MAG: hypothetical protein B5M53_07260 [Candidatus Cloacimonas sp. 4484_209]
MKRVGVFSLMLFFLIVSCSGVSMGIKKKSVSSAKIEKVEFKPDKKGNYYVYVTIRNISGKDKPFYLALQADDQVTQYTASGKKGQPNLVTAGTNYTFKVNTWRKTKPKRLTVEIRESLR